MRSLHSHHQAGSLLTLLIILSFVALRFYTGSLTKETQQNARETLTSIQPQKVTSFKILTSGTYTEDYRNAIEFKQEKVLANAFFKAVADGQPYHPQHDRALSEWWEIQILTNTTQVRIGCYIPDLTPDVMVGTIRSGSSMGYFQSQSLLRWYQKYGHYFVVDSYHKRQYSKVVSIISSISSESVTSFKIVADMPDSFLDQKMEEFTQETAMMMGFFQAIEDMQFSAPKYKEFLAQWKIEIHAGATLVTVECSIPADDPTLVIGLIDSPVGYTYFQSRQLYQWYQTYSHRWLTPGAS